jgi:hypothetical protein
MRDAIGEMPSVSESASDWFGGGYGFSPALRPMEANPNASSMPAGCTVACFTSWRWGLMRGGMLERNQLMAEADVERLSAWVEQIASSVELLLERGDPGSAFDGYKGRGGSQ